MKNHSRNLTMWTSLKAYSHCATTSATISIFSSRKQWLLWQQTDLFTYTCINNFYSNIDLSGEVIFEVVIDAPCEWTFKFLQFSVVDLTTWRFGTAGRVTRRWWARTAGTSARAPTSPQARSCMSASAQTQATAGNSRDSGPNTPPVRFKVGYQCNLACRATVLCVSIQWRIQDFPDGSVSKPRGTPTYYFGSFFPKMHESEKKASRSLIHYT